MPYPHSMALLWLIYLICTVNFMFTIHIQKIIPQELIYSFLETIYVIIRLNSRYCFRNVYFR